MFTPECGDRPDAPNIGIVLTDGVSSRDTNMTIPSADQARNEKHVNIYAIGVGDKVNVYLNLFHSTKKYPPVNHHAIHLWKCPVSKS